jgi:hypothetical protein
LKRFTDDAEAAEACGSTNELPVKTRRLRVIRASISSVLLLGIHGFQKLSRHQLVYHKKHEEHEAGASGFVLCVEGTGWSR